MTPRFRQTTGLLTLMLMSSAAALTNSISSTSRYPMKRLAQQRPCRVPTLRRRRIGRIAFTTTASTAGPGLISAPSDIVKSCTSIGMPRVHRYERDDGETWVCLTFLSSLFVQ